VVLVPVFGLGRAQEILAAVGRARTKKRLPKKMQVYLGGLARTITHCLIEKKFETPARDELLSEFKRAKFIRRGWNGLVVESNGAIEDLTDFSDLAGSIFIVTSGMLLKETLSGIILDKVKDDPKSGVAIVGYQDEDSPFWHPAEKVKCAIKEFHASAHASKRQLEELAKMGKNVVLVHCEARSFALPKNWCRPKDLTIVNLETLEEELFATDESSFIGWGLAQVTVAPEPVEKLNRIAEQLESFTRVLRVRSEGTESGRRIIFTVKAGKGQGIDDCLNRFKLEKSVLDVAPVSSIGSFDVTRQMVLNKFDELCRWLEIPPGSVEEPEIELFDYRDGCERSFFNRETGTVGFCRQLLCSDEEVLFPAFVFYEFARYLFSRMDWWKTWRGSGNKHMWEIFGVSLAGDVEATDDELKRVAELIRNRKMEDWKYWPCTNTFRI
jgi:hypothetical protein